MRLKFKNNLIFLLVFLVGFYLLPIKVSAEVIDKVIAYIDNKAITLSELIEQYNKMKKIFSDTSHKEILNTMINNILLLEDAKRMRLEGHTDEEILSEYINIKIRSAIFIKDEDINIFYNKNKDKFTGKDFGVIKNEIERYLFDIELNKQIKNQIDELKDNSEIKILL